MDNLKWEIGVLLNCYARRVHGLYEYDYDEKRSLNALYAKAIMLNIEYGFGIYYPIDDFIDAVNSGMYIDWDGTAKLHDANGEFIDFGHCDVKMLEDAKAKGAVYVAWFNR